MKEVRIREVERFMREELMKSAAFKDNTPRVAESRIEHSFRVAHIAREIAEREGLDEELSYVAGLLHDIGYSIDYEAKEDYRNHGRDGARIARPFLLSLGYGEKEVEEMCFGIAIHVDDKADFEGERTPLALTIGDADNIDRFDAFRLYESLQVVDYGNLPLSEQKTLVEERLGRLKRLCGLSFGTRTATTMWQDKIDFQISLYERLLHQVETSSMEA